MRTITIMILAVALALAGAACRGSGGGAPPDVQATANVAIATANAAQATVNAAQVTANAAQAKANAMARAARDADQALAFAYSQAEVASLRPAMVLVQYARITHDTEAETRALALFQETKAAWEAAHRPNAPVYVQPPAYVAPSDPFQQPDIDRLKREVSDLQDCVQFGSFC